MAVRQRLLPLGPNSTCKPGVSKRASRACQTPTCDSASPAMQWPRAPLGRPGPKPGRDGCSMPAY